MHISQSVSFVRVLTLDNGRGSLYFEIKRTVATNDRRVDLNGKAMVVCNLHVASVLLLNWSIIFRD